MENLTWIDALTLIGAGTCAYWFIRFLALIVRVVQPPPETAENAASPPAPRASTASPAATDSGPPPEHVAAISAALAAILGEHRLIHLDDGQNSFSWSAEGRWIHQTSHSHLR